MNIAFESGINREIGYIILDVDFSGAYAAAMAVVARIDWDTPSKPVSQSEIKHLYKNQKALPGAVPIVFCHLKFSFPENSRHACLPVPSPYGLLYPRTGVTTCTGPEVALAIEMGAEIELLTSHRFFPVWDSDMKPMLAFADFLAVLNKEREKHDKETLPNLLLKEISNSFYGKLAQGIQHRNTRNLDGSSEKLPPSKVTCPHYAAICTGIVRAALAAVIHHAEQTPGVSVLSATTDGCMLKLPFTGEIKLDDDGKLIPPPLKIVLPGLYERLESLYPIRLLQAGRKNMGLSPDGWLESKHVGDEALTIKTRGYVLRYKGKQTFLAKCGHQLSNGDRLTELFYDEKIGKLTVKSLSSFQDIAIGKQVDLVTIKEERRVNTDYDFKRILGSDGQTRLAESVAETIAYRKAAEGVRKTGRRATSEAVELYRAGVRQHGGTEAAMRRQILRAIAQNIGGWRPKKMRDIEIAEMLGISANELKNAKRRRFVSSSLPTGKTLNRVIKEIAKKLRIRVTPLMRSVLTSQ